MPWGAAPHGYGMPGGHHLAIRSSMADDGVSNTISERFLMRNDYCQTFVDTGSRPQNFIRDLDYPSRYSEYPKIERLISLKDGILGKRATPGMSLKCDLKNFDLTSLGTKFDVILIDPPWPEYQTRVSGIYVPGEDLRPWTAEELRELKIGDIAEGQSFCFLWCGETHLEDSRMLFKKWGFRRIEDICWVKTNRLSSKDEHGKVREGSAMYGDSSILQRTKEHCVVGVKGTVKRSEDTHFIHANCDTDLIMEEEKGFGSTHKPSELYETIEHFCLGRRRLELFGLDRNMRDGWLTLGDGLTTSNWDKSLFLSWFEGDGAWPEVRDHMGGKLLGSTQEIEVLRPKSPVRHKGGESKGNAGGKKASSRDGVDMEERPLPEDLGEAGTREAALGKDDEDEAAAGAAAPPPAQPGEMAYK